MPPIHVAQRPRFFNLCISGAKPQHGHFIEYAMSITNTLVQAGFLWGSYLFLSSEPNDLRLGDTLFIIGSVITFVFALMSLIETRGHWQNYKQAEREDRIEFWESTMFFFAGLIFMIGSFFYWPGIYTWWYAGAAECGESPPEDCTYIHDMEESGEAHGARCFIIGSVMFLIASMFNGIGLGMNKDEGQTYDVNPTSAVVHYIHIAALFSSQMGSVLFVAGSWMYRPVIGGSCSDFQTAYIGQEQEGQVVAAHACESTGTFGTKLYIIGSALYLVEALLNFTNSALKHKYCNDGKVGHKELPSGSDEELLAENMS
jgi:hypothetical protein